MIAKLRSNTINTLVSAMRKDRKILSARKLLQSWPCHVDHFLIAIFNLHEYQTKIKSSLK